MINRLSFLLLFVPVLAFSQSKDSTVAYDYGYRMYDARIGKAVSTDPIQTNNTPYAFVKNSATKKTEKTNTPSSFDTLLKKYKLTLKTLQNFKEVPVKNNSSIKYQYALKHDSLDFEIRFLLTDINTVLQLPEDKRSLSLFTSITLNASGFILPNIPKIQVFGKEIANIEYNADWVASSSFIPKSTFSEGFNICSVMALRKNNIGNVYVFFLMKKKEVELMTQTANCLTFKK